MLRFAINWCLGMARMRGRPAIMEIHDANRYPTLAIRATIKS